MFNFCLKDLTTIINNKKMTISAQEVNKLRQMTGSGMMDCKKALLEANGDFDIAIEFLRKKGQKVSASRADRKTSEGIIFTKISEDGSKGALVALSCETDFVAKNEAFIALGEEILACAFDKEPTDINALKAQNLGKLTVLEKIIENTGKIGEKLEISSFEILNSERVVSYVHSNKKLGVLVGLGNTNGVPIEEVGRNVAMQIASMNPIAVNKESVNPLIIEKEIEIGKEQARKEGKPEAIIEKIANGKLQKFFSENTLMSQKFVKDNSMTITQYLDSVFKGMTVTKFKRIIIE
tara:strand:+ start:489 stop:1370 length:882 start_codon:yes stop_codon:yes gene_type:complete